MRTTTRLLLSGTLLAGALEGAALVDMLLSVRRHRDFWLRESKNSGLFSYLALGDSAAQGVGSVDPRHGYVYRIKFALEEMLGLSVQCTNLSVSGATSKDVLVNQLSRVEDLAAYDLITLGVGGNDVLKTPISQFERDYTHLLGSLPSHCYIANLPYFGGRVRRHSKVLAMNEVIEDAIINAGYDFVDLYHATKDANSMLRYSADLFHPNARGYELWFSAFWTKISAKLVELAP